MSGMYSIIGTILLLVNCATGLMERRIVKRQAADITVQSSFGMLPVGAPIMLPLGGFNDVSNRSMVTTSSFWCGTTSPCACTDFSGGQRQNNEVWIDHNFQFKCTNGTRMTIGCVASRRANLQVIPTGQVITVNNFWHNCSVNNGQVTYSEEPSCVVNGQELKLKGTFRQGVFKMSCEQWGYDIVGCYYYNQQNVLQELAVNQSANDGIYRHVCSRDTQQPGSVKFYSEQTACLKNNRTHPVGETWVERSFKNQCNQGGAITILSCIGDDGVEVPVGQKITKNGRIRECFRMFNTVQYQESMCSTNGGNCGDSAGPIANNTQAGTGSQTTSPGGSTAAGRGCWQDGITYFVGQTWVSRSFKYYCNPNGFVDITACVGSDGTEVPVGSTIYSGGWKRECQRQSNTLGIREEYCGANCPSNSTSGTSTGQGTTAPVAFVTQTTSINGYPQTTQRPIRGLTCYSGDGTTFGVGQSVIQRGFKFQCNADGNTVVTACISPTDNKETPLGQTVVVNGLQRRCVQNGTRVSYSEQVSYLSQNGTGTAALSTPYPNYGTLPTTLNPLPTVQPQGNSGCRSGGFMYTTGQTWVQQGFKMLCPSDSLPQIIACISPTGVEVPVSQTILGSDGVRRQCTKLSNYNYQYSESGPTVGTGNWTQVPIVNGGTGNRTQVPVVNVQQPILCYDSTGKTYRPSESYVENRMRYQCQSTGASSITACVPQPGKEYPVGSSVVEGNMKKSCTKIGAVTTYEETLVGAPTVQTGGSGSTVTGNAGNTATTTSCTKENQTHRVGETWVQNNFKYHCAADGLKILGCVANDNKTEIPLNEQRRMGTMIGRCINNGPGYWYKEEYATN